MGRPIFTLSFLENGEYLVSLLIVPNIAKIQSLTNQLVAGSLYPSKINLFNNSHSCSSTTTTSNLVTATFSGYSQGTLSGLSVAGSLDGFNRAVASWSANTWTKSGATGNTIYGYWVSDSSGNLLWCETFDTPVPMSVDGAYLVITPKFTFTSQY